MTEKGRLATGNGERTGNVERRAEKGEPEPGTKVHRQKSGRRKGGRFGHFS